MARRLVLVVALAITLGMVTAAAADDPAEVLLTIDKIIPGGKIPRLRIPALRPGSYDCVGEHHESTAEGRFVAE